METVKKHDWGLIVAGIALVLVALVFFFLPGISLVSLTIIAGCAFLVAGVFDLINYFRFRDAMALSGWTLVYALCDIVLGIALIASPLLFSAIIPWVCGAFFIAFGIMELVNAGRAKSAGYSMGWQIISGIVSILCGLMFFIAPASFSIFLSVFLMMRGFSLMFYGWSINQVLYES